MLERMGRLIAQVVVWSLSVTRNRLDAKADHYLGKFIDFSTVAC